MSESSPKKEIILKPKNVTFEEKGNQLILTYHSKNRGGVVLFGFLLICAFIYTSISLYDYFGIPEYNRKAYEDRRITKIKYIKKSHTRFRKDIKSEYENIDMYLGIDESYVATLEALQDVHSSEESANDLLEGKKKLAQRKQRKAELIHILDSVEQIGAVENLTVAQLGAEFKDWENANKPDFAPTMEEIMIRIIFPGGALLLILLLFIWAYRASAGNDLITVDKHAQFIRRQRSNGYGKTQEISTAGIKQFYCEKKIMSGEYSYIFHNLMYIDGQDESRLFFGRVREARDALFLEYKIEEFLGIENIPVRGEM